MKQDKIKSYCKINLTLKVNKKLKNGFHSISSLITFSKLHDEIYISRINGKMDKIAFFGKFKKNIKKNENTVTKLLFLLRKKNFIKKQSYKISIKKNIPHGSGLGGGSSNAAVLLNYFNKKMKLKLKKNNILKLARKIGFDVPIAIEKKNTLLSGNKISRINKKFNLNLLIVYPNIICFTKKIYNNHKIKVSPRSRYYFNLKNNKKLPTYLKNQKNDLQSTAIRIYPKIGKILNLIKSQKGCFFSRITGSGSACIGIFSNKSNTIFAQKIIKSRHPKYWCVVSKTI